VAFRTLKSWSLLNCFTFGLSFYTNLEIMLFVKEDYKQEQKLSIKMYVKIW
jgi:hypothetical protein